MSDKIYVQNPDFVAREVAQEFILVPIRKHLNASQSLYVLNQTGASFWRSLDGKQCMAEIVRQLSQEYEVSQEQLEKDLTLLVSDLLSIEAVKEKGS